MEQETIEGFRLSPQQRRLWSIAGKPPSCQMHCAVLIEGPLHRSALRAAVQTTVERHEILRTTFACLSGMDVPIQVIGRYDPRIYREVDFRELSPAARDAAVEELRARERSLPRDLARDAALRATLVLLEPQRHLLLLGASPLCCDVRGMHNFVREAHAAYAAILENRSLEEVAVQYVDFSEWQNDLLATEDGERERERWSRQHMASSSLPLSGGAVAAGAPAQRLDLDPRLAEEIRKFCLTMGATPAAFFLTAWATLLWRLSGAEEVFVGICCDGRSYEGLESGIGLFARYMPLPCQPAAGGTFRELLQRIGGVLADLEARQEYFTWDFIATQDGSGEGRPFCHACFETRPVFATLTAAGASFSLVEEASRIERYDMALACGGADGLGWLEMQHDSERISPAETRRLLLQVEAIARSAVDGGGGPLRDLDLLGDGERSLLVHELGRGVAFDVPDLCLHQLFEEQAARSQERPAILADDVVLTYGELNARANRLARRLRELSVSRGELVAVCAERSPEMIIAVLAVLKAGAAYVPLDPDHPRAVIAFMLMDTAASVVLLQEGLRGRLPQHGGRAIAMDTLEKELRGYAGHDLEPVTEGADLAYVIYTSGSTGRPKGVMVPHRAICNRLLWAQREDPLTAEDRVLQAAAVIFDFSVWEIFAPLIAGAALVLGRPGGAQDSVYLVRLIAEKRVTVAHFVPPALQVFLDERGIEECACLEKVFSGGDVLSAELRDRCLARLPAILYNQYGPTETTVDSTFWVCERGAADPVVPIGRPIANTRLYLLNEGMRLMPIGAAGELYIGGAGVARGYLNRPALTAERFVPDPFADEPGARLYKTGDLVRYRPDGAVEFLGRLDQQVKIRGVRIEPGQIEAALAQFPGIRAAVVAAREDTPGERRLVAYVVPRQAGSSAGADKARHPLPNGMSIYHHNRHETDPLYHEIFEKQIYFRHGIALPERACVVDLGANIGMFTLFVSQYYPGARIYAIEPLEPLFQTLSANVGLYGPQVKPLQMGVAEASRRESYVFYPGYTVMSGASASADAREDMEFVKANVIREEGAEERAVLLEHLDEVLSERFKPEIHEVRVATLSQVIRENGIEKIDLLKMDVQRAELSVLEGIEEQDWDKIGQIVLEVHDRPGSPREGRLARILSMLEARGFQTVAEQDETTRDTDHYTVYARHRVRAAAVDQRSQPSFAAAEEDEQLSTGALRLFLQARLPESMIPALFVTLDSLPLLPNGKIDRRGLPAPGHGRPGIDTQFVAPRTPEERQLAEIWEQVLRVERVGIHDNFFELGGDSILSIQICARANKAGLPINPMLLFRTPTIGELAKPLTASARLDRAPDQRHEDAALATNGAPEASEAHYTPGDFPYAGLDQQALDRILEQIDKAKDEPAKR
ncbi:MAG: hypothetical protein QOH06_3651 [Acidobacteriota bacterium]|jgi:amino acid adenylation domain-containing protein/FkbM family methyltransferase|nr:hypothetical protein [Acidobacteriota bacterium]